MRRFRSFLVASALCVLLLPATAAALTPYPYGALPSVANATDCSNAYNLWKSRWLKTAGCGERVDNGSGGTTVSEGMGYGMLMAAYLESNDTLLEQLWTFYSANMDGNHLMNWSVSSGSCSNNWPVQAASLLSEIYSREVDGCKGLANGDAWGGCGNGSPKNYNPSYFRTGYLHSFDCFEGGTRWQAVRTQSYAVLNTAYTSYALTPDWVQAGGSYGASDAGGGYGYDACRTPWVISMDYLWWGNATAQNWGVKFTNSFYTQGGGSPAAAAAAIGDDYSYSSGAKDSNNHENCFVGAVGVAAMTSTNSAFANAIYSNLVANDNNSYFSDSLKVIYLMALTGQFQEPCSGGCTACTPTFSPTISPTPSPTPTPTPAFSLSKSGSASTAAVGTDLSFTLSYANLSSGPDTQGVTPGVSLQFNNAGQGASGTRCSTNFSVVNASGGAINLQNYRIRYFLYDPAHPAASSYATYLNYDSTGVAAAAMAVYAPTYLGTRDANMEEDVTFGSSSLGNGSSSNFQGQFGSSGDSWTMTMTDDWSYPGSVASNVAAQYCVLEQNVSGSWNFVAGEYPGGSQPVTNVTITDVLDSRYTFVGSTPAGGMGSGNTFSVTLASLAPGALGSVTLTVQVNATASNGQVIPNSAGIAASGYPSASSNTFNVTVGGASPSPVSSPTPSATPTPTPASTRTDTPSATPSASASQTPTASSTHSPASSPSDSPSATPSPSKTATCTGSPTSTASPTATPTWTLVPPGSTATATSSDTPAFSATPSATLTWSVSATPSASSTNTGVPTNSPAPTSTVPPTVTAVPTHTGAPTGTVLPTVTAVPTFTVPPTATAVPTGTSGPTAAPSATPPPGPPTLNPLSPAVGTAGIALGITLTGTNFTPASQVLLGGTPASSHYLGPNRIFAVLDLVSTGMVQVEIRNSDGQDSAPQSLTVKAPATPVPQAGPEGSLVILDHRAWPDPYTGRGKGIIAVDLEGSCDQVLVQVFTKSMVLVGTCSAGPFQAGWVGLPLPDCLENGANGLYYYRVRALRGASATPPVLGRLAVMR